MLAHKLRRASSRNPVLTYVTSLSDTADLTTYTFTGASIGTAAADRLVVIVAETINTSARTIDSATIGGVAATLVVKTTTTNNAAAAIFSLTVAAGTTADITFTCSGATLRAALHIYTITGLSSTTATDTDQVVSASATSLTRNVDVSEGGVMIGGGRTSNGAVTWTGLTEDAGLTVEALQEFSAASASSMTAEAGRTITATGGGAAAASCLAVAAWR